MDSKAEMYLKRAKTEMESAEILFETSNKNEIKENFSIDEDSTFYSGAISHAYYSIFYCAKAMLLTKKIETESLKYTKRLMKHSKRHLSTQAYWMRSC